MQVRRSMVSCVTAAASIVAVLFAGQVSSSGVVSAAAPASWLTTVNAYRAMSGLAPVTENTTWSAEGVAHSCYMLHNGISHDEVPGNPGYTTGGDTAGNSGNVAVSSSTAATPRSHIDLWMTGPFHAIGILRPQLTTSGFGICADESASAWHSGATLDVLRGINHQVAGPTDATVFPGRNATVALSRFVTESPNPLAFCGWTGSAGLPLIAMMPGTVTSATATLSGPAGPVQTCVLHGENTNGTAQSILRSDDAVVVVPREPLAPGTYTSTVNTTGGNVTWSFTIDPNAELQAPSIVLPDTAPASARSSFEPVAPYRYADSRVPYKVVRLLAGAPTTVDFGDSDHHRGQRQLHRRRPVRRRFPHGLQLLHCGPGRVDPELHRQRRSEPGIRRPVTGQAVPVLPGRHRHHHRRQRVLPCGSAATRPGSSRRRTAAALRHSAGRHPRPRGWRSALDQSKASPAALPPTPTPWPLNLTVVAPSGYGFIRAYPCDQSGSSEVSNVNFEPLENRPNSAIIPTSASGTICVVSNAPTDLLVDIAGYFVAGSGFQYTPLVPVRLLDTRSPYINLNPDTVAPHSSPARSCGSAVAGTRGIPSNARAVSVNVTAAGADGAGFVTVYPCGNVPNVSNLNFSASTPAIANGALVPLTSDGDVCLFTSNAVHLIVDINGVWS